jgi:hypothetical protein
VILLSEDENVSNIASPSPSVAPPIIRRLFYRLLRFDVAAMKTTSSRFCVFFRQWFTFSVLIAKRNLLREGFADKLAKKYFMEVLRNRMIAEESRLSGCSADLIDKLCS